MGVSASKRTFLPFLSIHETCVFFSPLQLPLSLGIIHNQASLKTEVARNNQFKRSTRGIYKVGLVRAHSFNICRKVLLKIHLLISIRQPNLIKTTRWLRPRLPRLQTRYMVSLVSCLLFQKVWFSQNITNMRLTLPRCSCRETAPNQAPAAGIIQISHHLRVFKDTVHGCGQTRP